MNIEELYCKLEMLRYNILSYRAGDGDTRTADECLNAVYHEVMLLLENIKPEEWE